ncbi:MAG: hypothetical protein ABI823_10495 [Bryobacteraceae bacterium]
MRFILLRSAICLIGLLLLWLLASRPASVLLDRFTTARAASIPAIPIEYEGGGFGVGDLTLTFAGLDNLRTDLALRSDGSERLILSSGGRTFPLGPRLSPPDPSGRPEIRFEPDAGDIVTLTLDRSWLAWPTFWDIKIMTRTAWFRRNAYYRLKWKKKSGAILDMLWRYEQQYYPSNRLDVTSGWTPPLMMFKSTTGLARVEITSGNAEAAAAEYVAGVKGWKYSEYRTEGRGAAPDGRSDLVAVIFLEDERGANPGAGKSLVLQVDRVTRKVIQEMGSQ